MSRGDCVKIFFILVGHWRNGWIVGKLSINHICYFSTVFQWVMWYITTVILTVVFAKVIRLSANYNLLTFQPYWFRLQQSKVMQLFTLSPLYSISLNGIRQRDITIPKRPVHKCRLSHSVTQGFDAFFDLRLNKWLSKQSRRWWFETPSRSLWRHCNV